MIGCHPRPTCVKNCTADIKEIFFCYYDDDDDDNENNNDYDTDGFCKGRKTGECPEKPSEQGQEPTTNLTHTGCLALESKPGCSCRR